MSNNHKTFGRFHYKHILYHSVVKACGDMTGKSVLDVGCGSGVSTRVLANNGASYVLGIGNDVEELRRARENKVHTFGKTCFITMDMTSILFLEAFGLVTAVNTLQYATTRETLYAIYEGMFRTLIPKGILVALVTNPYNPVTEYDKLTGTKAVWEECPYMEGTRIAITSHEINGSVGDIQSHVYWSEHTHLETVKQCGFSHGRFLNVSMSDEGRGLLGEFEPTISPESLEEKMIFSILTATKEW